MSTRGRQWGRIWILAALLGPACAQDRVATAGRVLDRAGKPVVGATVVFVGAVPPHGTRFENADRVEVRSDAKGRFRVLLLADGEYDAWASASADRADHYLVSELVDVRPGTGFELALRERRPRIQTPVRGLDAWSEHGPLRLELGFARAFVHRRQVEVVDGLVAMPPYPSSVCVILFAVDAAGQLRWAKFLRRGQEQGAVTVPPPQTGRVRVCDEQGNAVAGATIWMEAGAELIGPRPRSLGRHRSMSEWHIAGTTDASGMASVVFASSGTARPHPTDTMMMASKPGYRASFSGFFSGIVVDGDAGASLPDDGVLPFTLARGPDAGGQVVAADGGGVPGAQVEISARMLLPMRARSFRSYETAFRTTSDARGRFSFGLLPDLFQDARLHAALPKGVAAGRRAVALQKPDLTKPLRIDLRRLARIDLQVTSQRKLPARNADVLLLPVPIDTRELDASAYRLRLDNRGRASVPVQPGRWQIVATDRVGLAWQVVEVPRDKSVAMQLQPMPTIRGSLLVDEGVLRRDIRFLLGAIMSNGAPSEVGMVESIAVPLNRWLLAQAEWGADGACVMRFALMDGASGWASVSVGSRSVSVNLAERAGYEWDLRSR